MNKTARLKRLSRHLLATTCLTLAGVGAAHATTINETSAPGTDFGSTFGTATNLSSIAALAVPGTNNALGALSGGGDLDYFTFTGEPGTAFSYNITDTSNGQGRATILNSLAANIGSTASLTTFAFNGSPLTGTGLVPTDGKIIVDIVTGCECGFSYNATVSAPNAPEPGTLADVGLGLGLAGAIALGRRRRAIKA
jgi:hypothetical protein